jgi:hypothetical protein
MEEEWRKREAELKEVPPHSARPEDWPKGVRTIGLDEMNALGVDASGTLYWHGKSVAIRRLELRSAELFLATIAALGTLISGLAAMFPQLPRYMEKLF